MKMVHVTLYCARFEETLSFYKNIVGLKVQAEIPVAGIVFLADTAEDVKIELINDPSKAFKGSGVSVGFTVEDPATFREELISKGLNVSPLIEAGPRTEFFFVEDPEGFKVQFIN